MAAPITTAILANVIKCISRPCLLSKQTTLSSSSSYVQVRWAQYNPSYMDPIIDRKKLEDGLPEDDVRRHRPIKAPNTDCSISPLFFDEDIQKFTNMMMKGGNKERIKQIMRKTLENLKHNQVERYNKATSEEKSQIECNPVTIFKEAVENCKPLLMTKRVVKGGVAYRVPVAARPQEQRFHAMKWIIHSCRDKERRLPMEQKLAWELLDAYQNQGRAVRRKQEIHRMCESNRAYAHLR